MLDSKYSKFLTVLLVIIIIAIICLGGYLGYEYFTSYKSKKDADNFVETFIQEAEDNSSSDENIVDTNLAGDITDSEVESAATEKTYKGFNVIGTIEIPKTDIKYPVLQDPPTVKKLEVAVAALYPQNATLNTVGNVVIVGHNYRNGKFFSNNKKLENGDKIYITDLTGNKVTYIVYNVFQTSESDTSFYNRDTDGAKEITLSSCTDASNDQRIIVEARAE